MPRSVSNAATRASVSFGPRRNSCFSSPKEWLRSGWKGIAASLLPGDHFDFVGNADFGNHAGELRFDLASHLLQGDIDGDGLADFAIEVHAANLARGDLLL